MTVLYNTARFVFSTPYPSRSRWFKTALQTHLAKQGEKLGFVIVGLLTTGLTVPNSTEVKRKVQTSQESFKSLQLAKVGLYQHSYMSY